MRAAVVSTIVVPVAGMLLIGGISLAAALYIAATNLDVVERHAMQLLSVERMRSAFEWKVASNRGYFLTGDRTFLGRVAEARQEFEAAADALRHKFSAPDARVLEDIVRGEQGHQELVDRLVSARSAGGLSRTAAAFEKELWPRREELRLAIAALGRAEQTKFERARLEAIRATGSALAFSIAAVAIALLVAVYLTIIQVRRLQRTYETEAALRRDAEEALAARAEFLSVASHELRTPIHALKLQYELLRKRFERGATLAEQQDFLMRSERQLENLTRLADNVLDLVHYERGQFELHYENVDLVRLAREVSERFCGRGTEVECTVNADEQRLIVPADSQRLEQGLMNLLTNALKYGGGRPVHVTVSGDAEYAAVTVTDQGQGIAAEDQELIFHRFRRLRRADTRISGLGLGLYIARRVAEAHGGSLTVASEVGRGASFTLRLPRRRADRPTDSGRSLREERWSHTSR